MIWTMHPGFSSRCTNTLSLLPSVGQINILQERFKFYEKSVKLMLSTVKIEGFISNTKHIYSHGAKFISIGIALLMFIMPLSIASAQSVAEVESGLGGIIDPGTNIRNIVSFVGYAFGNFGFSMDWIRGMMDFIRNYPDSAGQLAGFYLGIISFFHQLWRFHYGSSLF
jgi:hypothetical protein